MSTAETERAPECVLPSQSTSHPSLLRRADLFVAGPHCPSTDIGARPRRARRFLWFEGMLSNASESFITNFITPFALAFGATNGQIGTLNSATNVAAALGLLPGAKLEERFGCRKRIFMLCTGVFGRLLLLGLVFLPFLFHASMIFYGLLGIIAFRSFLDRLAYPAWSALLNDLVPEPIRGRYFGARNIGVGLAALICTPLAGYLIKRGGSLLGYQIGFGIAVIVGLIATAVFGMIEEPRKAHLRDVAKREPMPIVSILTQHPRFAAFTGLAFLWSLSLQAAGPFFAVYQMRNLGANVFHIGALSSIGAFTGMVGQRIWGVQNDRRGAVWVMRVTGLVIPGISLAWAVIPSWWYLPAVEAVSSFLWSGYWLANFNLLLRMSPDTDRSRFVAVYQSVVSIASFIGPVLGGIVVTMFPIKDLFFASGVTRFGISLLFLWLIAADKRDEENLGSARIRPPAL